MILFGRFQVGHEAKEFDDPAFSTVTIQMDLFFGYDTLMADPLDIEFANHEVNALLRLQDS